MRLDRYLCETGFGTRSEVKTLIRKGLVTLNGETVRRPETKTDETADVVCCGGRQALYEPYVYWMLHKPAGVVSATEDRREKTVLDLIPEKRDGLFPVGRLDKDTEGLLLLTDDGALAHRLLSPGRHVDKTYFVRIAGCVTEEHRKRFADGLEIGDKKPALPAKLTILRSGAKSEAEVTIREGRYHQIKRMFEAVGLRVLYLKRLSMGSLKLDGALAPGESRRLTKEELLALKELTG